MGFSDADEFVDDAGPEFDPKLSPEPPELELDPEFSDVDPEDLGWDEKQIKELLTTQGNGTNWLLRLDVDDDTWKHTQDDLAAIAPPLTRILNRFDATRAAAAAGDELALGTALFNYGARNVTQRRRLIKRMAAIEEPVSGVAAPAGTGPPVPFDDDPFAVRDSPDLTVKGMQ